MCLLLSFMLQLLQILLKTGPAEYNQFSPVRLIQYSPVPFLHRLSYDLVHDCRLRGGNKGVALRLLSPTHDDYSGGVGLRLAGRRYSLLQMESERKTNLAIEELGIKANPLDDNDKYDLRELLVDILGYPTVQEAEAHRQANRLGNFDLLSEQGRLTTLLNSKNTDELQLCGCCGRIVNQSSLPFLSNMEDIKLGIGTRLYFLTLLYHILIFTVAFLLYSLYALITNLNASKQQAEKEALCSADSDCSTSDMGLGSKVMNNESFQNQLAIQSVLGLILVMIWGIVLINKHLQERKLERELKKTWLSASEFTLMLQKVPRQFLDCPQQQLLPNINEVFKRYETQVKSRVSFEVVKVSVGYPLFRNYQQNKEVKQANQQELKERRQVFTDWARQRQTSEYFALDDEKRTEHYESYIDFLTNTYFKPDHEKFELDDTNVVFVTLRFSKARQMIECLTRERSIWLRCCGGADSEREEFPIEGVEVFKAPEPDEVIWENIGFNQNIKLCRRVLIYVIALLLIGGSLGIAIGLGTFQVNQEDAFIPVLISLSITAINFLIEMLIIFLSYFENEFIKSREEASIGVKIAVSQIVNSIGVPLTLTYIHHENVFASGGLVTNVFFISLFNLLLPIGRLVDPLNLLFHLRTRYYSDPWKRLTLKGQQQFNALYACYEFQLGYQYAYIIKTAFFTAFFLTLQPVIAVFAPVGLLLMLLTNKYRLLYRFSKPNFHSPSVNSMLTFVLKMSMVGFGLGQLYFMNFQAYSIHFNLVVNWVTLGLAALLALFPIQLCGWLVQEQQPTEMDYNQKLLYLTTDYDRLNPKTKQEAIEAFESYLAEYKRCHLTLPEKSEMIMRSYLEVQKHNPIASFINLKEKTKTKIQMMRGEHFGSALFTNDRMHP